MTFEIPRGSLHELQEDDVQPAPQIDPAYREHMYLPWAKKIQKEVAERDRVARGATPLEDTRAHFHKDTGILVWDCARLPNKSDYDDALVKLGGRDERHPDEIKLVVIWIDARDPATVAKLRFNNFVRDQWADVEPLPEGAPQEMIDAWCKRVERAARREKQFGRNFLVDTNGRGQCGYKTCWTCSAPAPWKE